jgi:hypothetical protein
MSPPHYHYFIIRAIQFFTSAYRVFKKFYSYFNNLLRDNPNRHMQVFVDFSLGKKKLWITFTEHLYITL